MNRLRRSLGRADFLFATRRGRRVSTRHFTVFVSKRASRGAAGSSDEQSELGCGPARLGITVTRKVGNAVLRNRIKRLVRVWFRERASEFGAFDVVVIAKRGFQRDLMQDDVSRDLDAVRPVAQMPTSSLEA